MVIDTTAVRQPFHWFTLNTDFIGDLDIDGSIAAGFGIGNPVTAVGVEMAANVSD